MDDVLKILHFQILHAPAAGADKVTVGIGPAVENGRLRQSFQASGFLQISDRRERLR